MPLYPYQEQVKGLLLAGKSVALQAPTGSGKTRAALAPFIEAFFDLPDDAFPKQCLYSVPMRVLATQFEREIGGLAERYTRIHRRPLDVRIQTGERPEDPELMGDLVFATLDQVLSSALGVPYSLSASRANVNVAAVLGSYLVFDEFHLFPREAAQTTLQLLRSLRDLAPFVLMTATFSQTMLDGIAELLGAEMIALRLDEVEGIETSWGERPRKTRRFHVMDQVLTPQAVREAHDRRTLVVCNTVDRALDLYRGLVAEGCRPVPVTDAALEPIYRRLHQAQGEEHRQLKEEAVALLRERLEADPSTPRVLLLHSRFERPHRQVKEALIQALWSKDAVQGGGQLPSLIVVATQVVEVGLDISSQVLHTEVAPAASVFQRAGRCARYPGEQGQVYVYRVPEKDDGSPNYAPYGNSRVEIAICERTWEALRERDGAVLHFAEEQEVVDAAHGEADRAMLQAMREDEGRIWELITDAMVFGEASARPELIRRVDSRTVIVYDAPDDLTEESPYRYAGFSLWHGTLRGKLKAIQALADELGIWALRYPVAEAEEESRVPVAYRWLDVADAKQIGASLLFAVHPRLVAYDAEQGFRLAEVGDGAYRSPEAMRQGKGRDEYGYELESYTDHIRRMIRAFEGQQPAFGEPVGGQLRHRLAWLSRRFAELEGEGRLPFGLLERAVRLVIALHDVGKLDRRWQRWAAKYQEAIGEDVPPFLVVHTHYDPDNPEHKAARWKVKGKPKSHAGEGAVAALPLLMKALGEEASGKLFRAAVMAIARHHSPQTYKADAFSLHPQARATVVEALAVAGGEEWRPWADWLVPQLREPVELEGRAFLGYPPEEHWRWWFLYFVLARILRICDGLSQEAR
ncbi:MAG TPA: DEAD/DEAH box helicase [Caldilineae bacterium]|nr:DEAD/DEAH box helicase [Caldilineae bacterium]